MRVSVCNCVTGWWFGTWLLYAFMTVHSVNNLIIPTDELMLFRELVCHQPDMAYIGL